MRTTKPLPVRLLDQGIILKDWILEHNQKGKFSSDMALMLDVSPATIRGYARGYGSKLKTKPKRWCQNFLRDIAKSKPRRNKNV